MNSLNTQRAIYPRLYRRPFVVARTAPKQKRYASAIAEPLQDPLNIFVSCGVSLLIVCAFIAMRTEYAGWVLLPILLCGCLSGIDMVAYLRGKLDTFDPLGVLGTYAYYFFFLAPLLTLLTNYHTRLLPEILDWPDWIGWLSVINAFGLCLYLASRRLFPVAKPRTVWIVKRPSFFIAISIALPITFACQVLIFAQYGGIMGFMQTFSQEAQAFSGMGYLFLIAETFPILAAIAFLIWRREALRARSWGILSLFVVAFFMLKLVCGGLRGSRSLTIWALFWIMGAIHVWVRPVPRKLLVVAFLFTLVFMYGYGFYKDVGLDALELIHNPGKASALEETSGRTMNAVLLGDMARTDVQAVLLNRIITSGDFQYAYGTTYAEAFSFLIPKWLWADRPEGKVKAGTEALFGRGVYDRQLSRASYVYGLAGEAMLNFPALFVPLVFVPLAFVVSKFRSLLLADSNDLRLLVLPILAYSSILLLTGDLDNVLFAYLSIAVIPFVLIRACSRVAPRKTTS